MTTLAGLRRVLRVTLRLVAPLVVLAGWTLVSTSSEVAASVVPSPATVLAALFVELWSGVLARHLLGSLGRAGAGYLVAGFVGVPLGLLMGSSSLARSLVATPIELVRPLSSLAWIPLAILWFGIGFRSIVFVIFIITVFTIVLNTVSGVMAVDEDLVKAARTLGAGRWAIFRKVVFPSTLPRIFLGLRVALGGAWGGVLVAEMIASPNGIGFMIHDAHMRFNPALMIGGMFVIGAVGYLLNTAFLRFQRLLVRYAEL